MRRISDELIRRVEAGIEALQVLGVVRDSISYEVTPALMPGRDGMILGFMVAVSLPVPGSTSDDHVLYMRPLDDAHASQEDVSRLVQVLYADAQGEVDAIRARRAVAGNGHRQDGGE